MFRVPFDYAQGERCSVFFLANSQRPTAKGLFYVSCSLRLRSGQALFRVPFDYAQGKRCSVFVYLLMR
jgi:hypothetical protein